MKHTPLLLISSFVVACAGCVCDNTKPANSSNPTARAAAAFKDFPLGVIGETENVYLPNFKNAFEARIDTGATTSSIDAHNISEFERDGKKWVSFKIKARTDGEEKAFELPVKRVVQIKQHGAADLIRYSVILNFRMGHMTMDKEFTLTDRSEFEYPVLIGRNIINGNAVVDPSQRNIL